jgi:16S rRNA G966 N2-methylase RsmD
MRLGDMSIPKIDETKFREVLIQRGRWSSGRVFDLYFDQLFRGVTFQNRDVLDVGGGIGTCSFMAVSRGASKVVCLDPESEGATNGTGEVFTSIAAELNVKNARIEKKTLQQFEPLSDLFDVVIFHNSINHVEEEACIHLKDSEDAKRKYRAVFQRLFKLTKPGADIIIADCTSSNIFPNLGLKHPISRSIEWQKHQPPEVWINEMTNTGFSQPSVKWSAYTRLGELGWLLTANRLGAYFLTGHFMLHMKRL